MVSSVLVKLFIYPILAYSLSCYTFSLPLLFFQFGNQSKALIGCDGVHSVVAASCLGLTVPINSGRWAARGLARFPQGHGLNHDFQQFVTAGAKKAGFVPLNDKELYCFSQAKLLG